MFFGISILQHHRILSLWLFLQQYGFNPIALRKAKIAYNFGLSECDRVKCACIIPTFFHTETSSPDKE